MVHHVPVSSIFFQIEFDGRARILRLTSPDRTNRLTRACVLALAAAIAELKDELTKQIRPLIIAGNQKFFSVGADLNEVAPLTGPEAYEFSAMGQALMNTIVSYPAPVIAAIEGHCMGGGLDLALACHRRIAAPDAVFGHRGAALGLMTGWGGTQRLPRLIGKAEPWSFSSLRKKSQPFELSKSDWWTQSPTMCLMRPSGNVSASLVRPT
jgi:enoyl-CoA hydratase/carnithine racemase